MRHYDVRLSPPTGWFHPFEERLERTEGVRRVAIHRVRRLDDDWGVVLYELAGDRERAETVLEAELDSLGYWIEAFDGRIFVCAECELTETVDDLLGISRAHPVFVDPPMTYTRDGDLQVTVVATEDAFQQALAAVPDDVSVTLETKQPFEPEENVFLAKLTPTQRRLFETAIDLGYYGSPRETTYEKIGSEVDLAGGTVGEHLRKIEAKLVKHVVSEPVVESNQRTTTQ
ncbi:helix-turn-helix domain-containing protein [Natronolimnohabitans innermongolicus]|uniref:Bacterio-opsin activator HTH domain-containing protein n=1 Tax=Natronolimnohabitans innermongolicus JCM 12255 TaxID=1227499 RepID=L9WQP6_9EURY|nr:helix-turn-helix domain-containing protein [Natronolimnohabitans innermongolicus]ELY51722.1 Bacterio-opsin activator HTH domain-containing protein [Natronolimnohabitans innermongolicus JCM 12255]